MDTTNEQKQENEQNADVTEKTGTEPGATKRYRWNCIYETPREVNISEWTTELRAWVKPLDVMERLVFSDYYRIYLDESRPVRERAEAVIKIAILSVVDENGKQMLFDDDIEVLMKASFAPLTRIMAACVLPGWTDDSLKKD